MSVERKGRDDFSPTVQRRGERSVQRNVYAENKNADSSFKQQQPVSTHIPRAQRINEKPAPNIALLARVAGMIFVSMIFLLIMAPFFDDSGMVAGTITALFGIVWNLIFFGVFALILFPVFRKKLNPQYLSQLAFHLNEIKRSGRPPNLNK